MTQDPLKDTNGGPQNWHTSYQAIWGGNLVENMGSKPKSGFKTWIFAKNGIF